MFDSEILAEAEDCVASGQETERLTNPDPDSAQTTPDQALSGLLGGMSGGIGDAVLSAVRVGIAVYDRNKRYVFWNPTIEAMFGLRADEVIGRPESDFPFTKEAGLDVLLEKALGGESGSCPDFHYFVSRSGSAGWASARFEPVRDSSGQVGAVIATVQDITPLKLSNQALRHSEERYRAVVERAADVFYMVSPDCSIIALNQAFDHLTGWQRADWIGKSFLGLLHPDDVSVTASQFQRVLRGEPVTPFELRFATPNGEYLVGECTASAQMENGRVVSASGIVRDVTARKRADDALQLAEEKYRSIFENAVEGIFQSTPGGRFITVNPALVRMLGYDSTRDLMESCTDIEAQLYTDPERRKEFQNQLESHGTVQHFENQVYRKDGSVLWISESGRAVRAPNGAVLYYEGTVEDITGLKQAEKERLHLEEQLLQAQRIESIGLLAGGVAHDFNNLLTAIIGYAQIVESRLGPDHPLNPEAKQIVDSGQRAAALTRQLLAFSRRQTLLRRSVNLNDTLSNLMSMLRRIIGEDVEIRCRQQPGLCSVLANSGQIEQVIMNLAVNARDAMPDGGLLLIATRNVTLDEAYCREHAWAKPGHYVLVSVSDNGVGMDAEVQRRIFEPFFTTKQVGKGTGLGLSVVYGIVKQHDALIHVDSSPGHGTTFRIYFKADEPPAAEESREEAASVRGGNETVLVAEDEPALRGLAKNILEGLGYRVLLAENGERAVAECERAMNEIDLFVLDLMMPRMGGREAYERIRALRSAECPVIFMTGHAHETLRDELVRSRSAEIVQKPYQLDELGRKVRDVLDARPRAGSQLRLGIRTKEISDSGALQT